MKEAALTDFAGRPADGEAVCVLDAQAMLGEGALWDDRRKALYWVDIHSRQLHRFDPATERDTVWALDQMPGTVVPRTRGGLLLALQTGVVSFDPDTGKIGDPVRPADYDAARFRFNDGKCDPEGRFWVGSMGLEKPRLPGALYRFDPDGSIHVMLREVGTSNGIVWADDLMYFIDTSLQRVDAFNYRARDGVIENRRVAIDFPATAGRPDGSTLDAEGMLWIAHWEGARVSRWNPRTGECLREIRVPVERVTSCAFGGDKLDRLYITTARVGASPESLHAYPLSGGLFAVDPGVRGRPACAFAG